SLKIDAPKEVQIPGKFKCELCELSAPYTYYGWTSPNSHSISEITDFISAMAIRILVVLLEEACVIKDPFTPDKDKFLIIRSHCSLCSRAVCVGTDCYLFYSKSFCLPRMKENIKAFSVKIQNMDRRKPQQKSCKKKKTNKKKNGYKA
ncbi:hypothetical protein DV515_00013446, partial [Chloebia gouldiae]